MKPLFLILMRRWFDEIESGEKTVEYRRANFWEKRLEKYIAALEAGETPKVIFQLGYHSNAARLEADIVGIKLNGSNFEISILNAKRTK